VDKKIVILISGRGSNMEAIVHAVEQGQIQGQIAAVIANKQEAAGLRFAAEKGIPTHWIDHRQFDGREAFDQAMIACIDQYEPTLVVLAGFMRILTPGFVEHYKNRLMNIHPSLLPSFPGLHTHARAIAEGVKCHGCTVHFVTPELDHGPIIIQGIVPVLSGDTEDTLAERVLKVEHQIYPKAIQWFINDRLTVDNGVVSLTSPEVSETQLIWGQ